MKIRINEKRFYVWKNIAVISILLLYIWLIFIVRHDMIINPEKYVYSIDQPIPSPMLRLQKDLNYITWGCIVITIILLIRWYKTLPPDSKFKIVVNDIEEAINEDDKK